MMYSVVDLFAGPGGLGEGFAALRPDNQEGYVFQTVLSIEKEKAAHQTLKLRHFFRTFPPNDVPDDYYKYLEGQIKLDELYTRHREQATHAEQTAWRCELGGEDNKTVKERIANLVTDDPRWVLVGGPPCQAYSRAGRSRMKGKADFENDPRHYLYLEYLRILADHSPPVFVMENVVGLISAQLKGVHVIRNIIRDLQNPALAIYTSDKGTGYTLYSLSQAGRKNQDSDPKSFVIKAEQYGLPQARHRIFIIGIRNDINVIPEVLTPSNPSTVREVIGDLPKLRSGLSKISDSESQWVETLRDIRTQGWYQHGRGNGLAEFTAEADAILDTLNEANLHTSSTNYALNTSMAGWFKDDRLKVLLSHESRSHKESDLHRYFYAAVYAQVKGQTPRLKNFPEKLLPAHKNVETAEENKEGQKEYSFADRFRVQMADSPATTITSHISKDGHYFIHYDPAQCRSLTVREAARLQTFPDNYKFEGTRTQQYQQVGNAVPPFLAMQIARVIWNVLKSIT